MWAHTVNIMSQATMQKAPWCLVELHNGMNGSHSGSAALQVDHLILQGEASAEEMRGFSEGAAARSRTMWDKVWQERPFDWLALGCLLSSAGVPVCVVPGVMGGGDSDRKFFLIVRTKRCRLTDRLTGWLAGWLADLPPLWVADRLHHWPCKCPAV